MTFREFLKNNIVCLDGGMGTLLQQRGLVAGELPERWNITHAEEVCAIHRAYFDAGSNVVNTNTFGANALKFEESELESIIEAAVKNAKRAREMSVSDKPKFIALDIGPSGKLLKPLGNLDFEDAVELFAKTVRIGVNCGVDLIFIETMNDSYETKAALLAAKENSDLPVLVSNAYGQNGQLMTGATPSAMVALLEGMGADAIGANCSLGPKQLRPVVEELLATASTPVILKPNAGLPKVVDGKTVFDVTVDEFADEVFDLVQKGVRVIGGCCGTTPAYVRALNLRADKLTPLPLTDKNRTVVSSYSHAVSFDRLPILIGERINPTGKKRFKQALQSNDMGYILSEGVHQQERGAHILDVNVGLPEIDEKAMLVKTVSELQAVLDLPLQIDTADPIAMEAALRCYNGKAMVNSVNGKHESMEAIFPLVKKYGGVVVALTLDENGIPDSAEKRFIIAERILKTAESYGIAKKDIVFDPLAMTVSANDRSACTTLESLKRIRNELGCHTSLGVSNVSFGLPERDTVNTTFFAMALESGLSAAIMNPDSVQMMNLYHAYRALKGLDSGCADYIASVQRSVAYDTTSKSVTADGNEPCSDLQQAIRKGLKERAAELTAVMSATTPPMQIVNDELIAALNAVGKGFETGSIFLPQLLMSAEAAKAALAVVKTAMENGKQSTDRGTVVIATVRGDVHDIGKNILKLLLETYGFTVVDLGKDVPPDVIVETVERTHAPLVGLSALMTTTVPAMEKTIALLKERTPWCKVMVGGAVLTEAYAKRIGADHYAADAMEGVRYAEHIIPA